MYVRESEDNFFFLSVCTYDINQLMKGKGYRKECVCGFKYFLLFLQYRLK